MKIENVQGIAWDLDGTVVDSFDLTLDIISEMVIEHGLKPVPKDVLAKNYHKGLGETFKDLFGADDSDIAGYVDWFHQKQEPHYQGDTSRHFFEDAVALADQAAAQGIDQFIITNRMHAGTGTASVSNIIAASALAHHFKDIKCRDQVVEPKPSKRALEGWFEAHNISHDKLLVIGDTHVDADLAMNIGARAIIIDRHQEGMDDLRKRAGTYVVENLAGIMITKSAQAA